MQESNLLRLIAQAANLADQSRLRASPSSGCAYGGFFPAAFAATTGVLLQRRYRLPGVSQIVRAHPTPPIQGLRVSVPPW